MKKPNLAEDVIDEMFGQKPTPDFKSYVYYSYRNKFPEDVDIEKEFALIQEKKSKLSRSQREAVEFCYYFSPHSVEKDL